MKAAALRLANEIAPDGKRRDAVQSYLEQAAAVWRHLHVLEPGVCRTPLQRLGRRGCREMREHGIDVPVAPRRMDALVPCWKVRTPACNNNERVGQRGCHEHNPGKQSLHASEPFVADAQVPANRPGTSTVAMNANEPVSRTIGFSTGSFEIG